VKRFMPTPVGRVDGMRASARGLIQVYRGAAQWLPELNGNRNPGRKEGGIAGLKVADARNSQVTRSCGFWLSAGTDQSLLKLLFIFAHR
jgi:hypothetical protein